MKILTSNEEYDFIGVYAKGKRSKELRFLLKNKKTNEEVIFWIDKDTHSSYGPGNAHPFGLDFGLAEFKWVTKTHIKNKNYNYYFIDNDITKLESELARFKAGRKYWPVKGQQGLFDKKYNPYFLLNGKYY